MTVSLEALLDAHLAGERREVPDDLREEFDQAVTAYEAIQFAMGETICVPADEPADRPPPELPNDYEIVRELGRGGMGVVYLVQQKSLDRQIAVKVLRPGETTFGPLVKRFLEEARHLARLRHPHIVSVHEIGQAGDEPYFTMDFVEGEPLSTIMKQQRLSPTRALAILKQAAEGVAHAHEHGIIHRDLKPGNILVDSTGHAYVTDFGLARDMTQTSDLTRSGEVMGTPAYMAPEQAQGQSELIGEATDVHALGVILYEMLTGRPPYGNDAPANVLVRLLKEEPVPPRQIDRRIPRDLETICLKAMAKQPDRRYATVRAFLEDIHRYESGQSVLARRPGPVYHAVRFVHRHWKIAAAVAVTAAVLLAIAPRLFDRSVEELRRWGDERHAAGEHADAVRIYQRALQKATGAERRQILEHMVRCAREIGDMNATIEAALGILEFDPDISFGEHDYLVAQAVVARIRSENINHTIRNPDVDTLPMLELAERRFEIFLNNGDGTEVERRDAEQTLTAIRQELGELERPWSSTSYPTKLTLPEMPLEQLQQRALDESVHALERGKAAYVAATQLEKRGETAAALAAYRQAFDLIRSVYPVYEGLNIEGIARVEGKPSRLVNHGQTPESGLLADVFSGMQRLDPATPAQLTGGIRLRVEGVAIPRDLAVELGVTLCAPELKYPDRGLPSSPHRGIYLPLDGPKTAWIGVADGKYRLEVGNRSMQYETHNTDVKRFARLLVFDFDEMPEHVEIRGETVDLPPIRARLAQEIDLLEPAAGATVDLNRNLFRWSAVERADHYQLSLGYLEDSSTGSMLTGIGGPRAKTAQACIGLLEDAQERSRLAQRLRPGRTAIWDVIAYDADGRVIGKSVEESRPFLVARGLESSE